MSPHFSPGKADLLAFVLSCPGRHEEAAGHPAAGTTGRHLERLLSLLSQHGGMGFERADVTIANAWSKIEYESSTGRSEASDEDVRSVNNIHRLADDLKNVTGLIVFCGVKAELAAAELRERKLLPRVRCTASIKHLGTRGLCSIDTDEFDQPIIAAEKQRSDGRTTSRKQIECENTTRRLAVLAASLAPKLAALRSASGSS